MRQKVIGSDEVIGNARLTENINLCQDLTRGSTRKLSSKVEENFNKRDLRVGEVRVAVQATLRDTDAWNSKNSQLLSLFMLPLNRFHPLQHEQHSFCDFYLQLA
jgi:hypothetical protein